MSTSTPEATVIQRIHKLLNVRTDRGASETEAVMAAGHVQRLLAEHNLSMAEIESSGGASAEGGKREKSEIGHRQVYKWQRRLMASIAELNFCYCAERFKYMGHSRPDVFDGYELIGRVDNVVSTRVMFEYLLQTINRLTRGEYPPDQFFTKVGHSFKEGCADRLVVRLKAELGRIVEDNARKVREEQTRSQHPGTAKSNLPAILMTDMIQREKDLNEDMRRGLAPGTTEARRREYEARQAAEKVRRDAEIAAKLADAKVRGVSADILEYIRYGWSEDSARESLRKSRLEEGKPETETQRRRRESSDRAHYNREWSRKEREARRLDQTAYMRGHDKAGDVGLDRQLDEEKKKRLN